jgi:hypothetical protein
MVTQSESPEQPPGFFVGWPLVSTGEKMPEKKSRQSHN